MTRHFLRDKNGEEAEIPCLEGSSLSDYYMYVCFRRDHIRIEVKKVEIWIGHKLHFVVWQEV